MNILIFDTETVNLTKPFCYNVGYVIADTDNKQVLAKRDFVVEQIWHNIPLFSSAYYADKRPIYVSAMRAQKTKMDKWGYIMRQMSRDVQNYEIKHAYAFNSPFDDKVFDYNCDYFKTTNPFDTVEIHDIRGYVCNKLINENYKKFCDENEYYTENGNYSTTAETVFRYISGNNEFDEAHTALADSEIETEILFKCLELGSDITESVACPKSIARECEKVLTVKQDGQETVFTYNKKIVKAKNSQNEIIYLH